MGETVTCLTLTMSTKLDPSFFLGDCVCIGRQILNISSLVGPRLLPIKLLQYLISILVHGHDCSGHTCCAIMQTIIT